MSNFSFNFDGLNSLPVSIVDASNHDLGVRFIDVNKDGFDDIIKSFSGTRSVYLSNGTAWNVNASWTVPIDFVDSLYRQLGVELVDVNSDGYPDIVQALQGGTTAVYVNAQNGSWILSNWSFPTYLVDSSYRDAGVRFVDINGDGLPDILESRNYGTQVSNAWLNNGSAWTLNTTWTPPTTFASSAKADTGVRFFDANGDGLVDMVEDYLNGSSTSRNAWMNTGAGWVSNPAFQTPESFTKNGANVGMRQADVNGDGFADQIFSVSTTNYTWVRNDTRAYLLTSFVNAYGGVTNLSYNYSTAYDNTLNNISQIGICIPVVSSWVRNNSLAGAFGLLVPVNYTYAGGKYSYANNEFRGFATSTEMYASKNVVHTWYQDDARKGKELSTSLYDPNGSLISKSVSEWNYTTDTGVYNLSKRYDATYQYDGLATPVIHNITYAYNVFGNPQYVVDMGDIDVVGDEIYSNYTYGFDTADWIINRVSRKVVYDQDMNKVSDIKYYYDTRGLGGVGPRGDLTKTEEWNNNGNNTFTYFTYDTYGNVVSKTDSLGRTTKFNYDATNTYLASTINSLGYVARFVYNTTNGALLTSETNGFVTTNVYDQFGRQIAMYSPVDDQFMPTTATNYSTYGVLPYIVTQKNKLTANKSQITRYIYDGFGNVLQVRTDADNGSQIVKNVFYDASSRVAREQNPYFDVYSTTLVSPISGYTTNYTYDPADRVIRVTNPDGSSKQTAFSQYNISDWDEKGNKHMYVLDGRGRIASVYEFAIDPLLQILDTYITSYSYDGANNLVKITDSQNNQFAFTYDSPGRKTSMVDPDMGTWTYNYDDVGNLIRQTDNRGQSIVLTYDALNRVLSKKSTDVNTSFVYDVDYYGTLTNQTFGNSSLAYAYDSFMRPYSVVSLVDGQTDTGFTYLNSQGTPISFADSMGDVDYLYSPAGFVKSIPTYVTTKSMTAFGSLGSRTLANGVLVSYSYSPSMNRLTNIGASAVINLTYTYDLVGNIVSINDSVYGRNHSLVYDSLNRLIYAAVGVDVYRYAFDSLGRIKKQVFDNTSMKYVYDGAQLHAPSTIVSGSAGIDVYKTSTLFALNKSRVFEFVLASDLNTTVPNVNALITFGDGQSFSTNLTVNSSVLFFVQNNYSNGGDYTVNVSASSTNISDWQKFNIKFGARAYLVNKLYSNASYYTFEFIGGNDINQTIYNVSWNCSLASSSLTMNLTGLSNISDYLAINYVLPGLQTFACMLQSPDGNQTASKLVQINGLTINDYDILQRNVSSKVVYFNVKNEFNTTTANISLVVENTTSSQLTNLSTNQFVMVFAQVNYSTDGLQSLSASASAFGQTQNYTEVYDYRGVSIDNYNKISSNYSSAIYLFNVVNNWLNGTVSWNITDPSITGTANLSNNQSVMVFIATNYTQGTKKPIISAQRASYIDAVREQFGVRPLQLQRLSTLVETSNSSISELNIVNNQNSAQVFDLRLDNSLQNTTSTELQLNSSNVLVYVATNYSTTGVYPLIATINSSTNSNIKNGVVSIS